MNINSRRVRAVVRKELRDFRRNRSLTVAMAIIPVLFCVQPLVAVLTLDPAASTTLRDQLFARTLTVRTLAPLSDPGRVFGGLPAVDGWHRDGPGGYLLAVSDASLAAPAVTRALVEAGADVLSITESHRSLEDVYLELIDENNAVRGG